MADLHMRVGQAEAQSGNVQAGLRHLERSIEILEASPHAALMARCKLALSSSLALTCRNDEAKGAAGEALSAAELAGSVALIRLCRANLSQLQYRTGAIRAAAKASKQILGISDLSVALRLAVLETNVAASLELGNATQESAEVAEFLERMNTLAEPSWIAVEAVPTQARLIASLEGWQAAHRALETGRALSQARAHIDNVCRLWFVEAELSFSLAALAHVEYCLGEATRLLGASFSLEMSALLERARGLIALRTGARSAAIGHMGRAERTFAGAGLRTEARRTRRLLKAGLASAPDPLATTTTRRRCSVLHDVTASSYLASLSSSPSLLVSELERHLVHRGLAAYASRVLQPATASKSRANVHQIACGSSDGQELYVVCEPESSHVAQQQLQVLRASIERAVEAEARKSTQESFAAFLEIEPLVESSLGLYLSTPMRSLLKQIRQIARTDLPVLVAGETGTGKDILARDLHNFSPRSTRPLIALNVAAVPRDMLEGQLFGYRRGAFTGAVGDAKGLIREAEGGTLFIDEIGDLSPELQPKLLRFLESGEIQPLGELPQRVDVRIVAATNARLEALVKEGRFREDLFYRLNVVTLIVPPLRERREEIPTLIHHFLTMHARQAGKLIPQLTPRALERLSAYDWPGNVRQLTNELKRIVALCDEDELVDLEHLAPLIRDEDAAPAPPPSDGSTVTLKLDRELQELYDDLERAAIARAMDMARQNQSECARRLGITRKGLYLKRKRLGLVVDPLDEEEADLTPARSAS